MTVPNSLCFFVVVLYSTPRWNPSSHHLTTNCFTPLQPAAVNCQLTSLKYPQDCPLLQLITQQVLTSSLHGFQVLPISNYTNRIQSDSPLCLQAQPVSSLSSRSFTGNLTFCISKAHLSLRVKFKTLMTHTSILHFQSWSLFNCSLINFMYVHFASSWQANYCQEGKGINMYWTLLGVWHYTRYKTCGYTVSTIKISIQMTDSHFPLGNLSLHMVLLYDVLLEKKIIKLPSKMDYLKKSKCSWIWERTTASLSFPYQISHPSCWKQDI